MHRGRRTDRCHGLPGAAHRGLEVGPDMRRCCVDEAMHLGEFGVVEGVEADQGGQLEEFFVRHRRLPDISADG